MSIDAASIKVIKMPKDFDGCMLLASLHFSRSLLSRCCLEHGVVLAGAAYSVVIVRGIIVTTIVVKLSPEKSETV